MYEDFFTNEEGRRSVRTSIGLALRSAGIGISLSCFIALDGHNTWAVSYLFNIFVTICHNMKSCRSFGSRLDYHLLHQAMNPLTKAISEKLPDTERKIRVS